MAPINHLAATAANTGEDIMIAKYRKQGSHLYKLQGNAYVHCANLPLSIKTLAQAIRWYEAE